ncbi:hypothetical protein C8J57DRAFT_1225812 [Mycena rebaudengoi]|nr:hypothetical protein C8J57DRAFT_1225812 [Mycena rebaudengoi]
MSKGETRRNAESNPVTVLDDKSWGSSEAEWRPRNCMGQAHNTSLSKQSSLIEQVYSTLVYDTRAALLDTQDKSRTSSITTYTHDTAQQEYKTVFSPLEASRVDTRKQGAGEEHGAQNIKDSQPAQITSKGETRRNTESNPVTVLDNKSWGSNEAEWLTAPKCPQKLQSAQTAAKRLYPSHAVPRHAITHRRSMTQGPQTLHRLRSQAPHGELLPHLHSLHGAIKPKALGNSQGSHEEDPKQSQEPILCRSEGSRPQHKPIAQKYQKKHRAATETAEIENFRCGGSVNSDRNFKVFKYSRTSQPWGFVLEWDTTPTSQLEVKISRERHGMSTLEALTLSSRINFGTVIGDNSAINSALPPRNPSLPPPDCNTLLHPRMGCAGGRAPLGHLRRTARRDWGSRTVRRREGEDASRRPTALDERRAPRGNAEHCRRHVANSSTPERSSPVGDAPEARAGFPTQELSDGHMYGFGTVNEPVLGHGGPVTGVILKGKEGSMHRYEFIGQKMVSEGSGGAEIVGAIGQGNGGAVLPGRLGPWDENRRGMRRQPQKAAVAVAQTAASKGQEMAKAFLRAIKCSIVTWVSLCPLETRALLISGASSQLDPAVFALPESTVGFRGKRCRIQGRTEPSTPASGPRQPCFGLRGLGLAVEEFEDTCKDWGFAWTVLAGGNLRGAGGTLRGLNGLLDGREDAAAGKVMCASGAGMEGAVGWNGLDKNLGRHGNARARGTGIVWWSVAAGGGRNRSGRSTSGRLRNPEVRMQHNYTNLYMYEVGRLTADDDELEGDRLQPAYVPFASIPAANATPSIPVAIDQNADAPVSGGVDEDAMMLPLKEAEELEREARWPRPRGCTKVMWQREPWSLSTSWIWQGWFSKEDINVRTRRDREAEGEQIVFVTILRGHALMFPNLDNRRRTAERAVMFYVEPLGALKNEPRLVRRVDGTGPVEFSNVQDHRLRSQGSVDDLRRGHKLFANGLWYFNFRTPREALNLFPMNSSGANE